MTNPLPELSILAGLPPADVDAILRSGTRRSYQPGDLILREGEAPTEILVLLEGRAELRKRTAHVSQDHAIGEVGPGDVLGPESLFDRQPYTVSARALVKTTAWVLPHGEALARPPVVLNLARLLAARVRHHGEDLGENVHERTAMGELIVKIIVLLCGYALLLAGLPEIEQRLPKSSTFISVPVIALFGWVSWSFIRNSGYPLWRFGLGFRNLLPAVIESILLTPIFMALLVGVKWALLQTRQSWRSVPLIQFPDWRSQLASPRVQHLLIVYAISSLVQEMIVRCAMQSSLERFLIGKGTRVRAILASAVLFSSNHLHINFLFALLAFLPGIFWGWMFSRRPHLFGVALSHFVVGAFVFFVLGISLP